MFINHVSWLANKVFTNPEHVHQHQILFQLPLQMLSKTRQDDHDDDDDDDDDELFLWYGLPTKGV